MLVDSGTPLKLADGSVVLPNGKIQKQQTERKMVEIPTRHQAQQRLTKTRRRLADLPALPSAVNAISVVLSYTMIGIDDHEIAEATGLSVEQVGRIKMLDAYNTMYDHIVKSILEKDTDDVRDFINKHAIAAARKSVDLLTAENEAVQLAAAKDILDRAGHRPADVVEHRHKLEGGLTIEYTTSDKSAQAPVIDLVPLE